MQSRFEGRFFTVPLDKSCRHLVRFLWEGNLCEFLCLCFGLEPVPRVFTKILKVPISLLRRLNIRVLIYLDDMLLMSQSIERLLVARDTVIFLLQHLGFVINFKKSVMETLQTIEYLGLVINSIQMTISLTEEKVKGILQECKIIFSMKEIKVLQLTVSRSCIIHHTSSSSSSDSISLSAASTSISLERGNVLQRENYSKRSGTGELQWWIGNLTCFNGRYLIQAKPQIIIQTDASMEGWGANCMGIETGGKWSVEERK